MNDWKTKTGPVIQTLFIYRYPIYGILVSAFLFWLISFFNFWQLYVVAGFAGGMIAGKEKNYMGSVAGAAGFIIGSIAYLNFTFISSIEIWNQFTELLLGISGGVFSIVLPLFFLAILGSVSGYTGALMLPVILIAIEKVQESQKQPTKK